MLGKSGVQLRRRPLAGGHLVVRTCPVPVLSVLSRTFLTTPMLRYPGCPHVPSQQALLFFSQRPPYPWEVAPWGFLRGPDRADGAQWHNEGVVLASSACPCQSLTLIQGSRCEGAAGQPACFCPPSGTCFRWGTCRGRRRHSPHSAHGQASQLPWPLPCDPPPAPQERKPPQGL